VETLEDILDSARIVNPAGIPENVVTMHSARSRWFTQPNRIRLPERSRCSRR
jgi:hypothetical protein